MNDGEILAKLMGVEVESDGFRALMKRMMTDVALYTMANIVVALSRENERLNDENERLVDGPFRGIPRFVADDRGVRRVK